MKKSNLILAILFGLIAIGLVVLVVSGTVLAKQTLTSFGKGLTTVIDSEPVRFGEGEGKTYTYDYRDFRSVEIGGPFYYQIKKGDWKVELQCEEVDLSKVKIERIGTLLSVRYLPRMINQNRTRFNITLYLPEIELINISGASSGTVENFIQTGKGMIDLSGASKMTLINSVWSYTHLDISGASKVDFSETQGILQSLKADISGASKADLTALEVNDAEVEVSGASTLRLKMNGGKIVGDASGASSIQILGTANTTNLDSIGASKVSQQPK